MTDLKLKCRLDVCNTTDTFSGAEEATQSEWTDICPMGVHKNGNVEHPAYCPGHSK